MTLAVVRAVCSFRVRNSLQAHSGKRGEIAVYGQESNADTWKMAKMNMAIRGIDADFGPYQADTFLQ